MKINCTSCRSSVESVLELTTKEIFIWIIKGLGWKKINDNWKCPWCLVFYKL